MTRWTFRIVLCLFLGAVTTVGVAWGLAWDGPWIWHPGGAGMAVTDDASTSGLIGRPSDRARNRREISHGWPVAALRCEIHPTGVYGPAPIVNVEGGIAIHRDRTQPWWIEMRVLPYQPIWPGFLIDTFLYAVIWFGLDLAIGAARRTLRRARGQCPMCTYDLRGAPGLDTGCPECGWNRETFKGDSPA